MSTTIARTSLKKLGYKESIIDAILQTLLQNGTPESSLGNMIKLLAGRPEVGEDGGLQDLVIAIERELKLKEGKKLIPFQFIIPNTSSSTTSSSSSSTSTKEDVILKVTGLEDTTLFDIAHHEPNHPLGEYLECSCSGIMACSTCHIILDPYWYSIVGKPSEAEQDMLDLAFEPTSTSRLACQIRLTSELCGLSFRIPNGSNNIMDFIPFED